jgi:hypothetical protein
MVFRGFPSWHHPGMQSGVAPESEVSEVKESPVLIHVWDIDPAEESAAVGKLEEMFGKLVEDPGFVSARVLESPDSTSIAALVEMRSADDRQRIEHLPDVREILDHLHGSANIVIRLYHEVREYPA